MHDGISGVSFHIFHNGVAIRKKVYCANGQKIAKSAKLNSLEIIQILSSAKINSPQNVKKIHSGIDLFTDSDAIMKDMKRYPRYTVMHCGYQPLINLESD